VSKRYFVIIALLLGLILQGLLFLSPDAAAAPPPPGEETLFALADYVLEGQVARIVSAWDEGRTTIYSLVTLAVSNRLKGYPDNPVMIKHLGGQVGDVGLVVSTEPQFVVGEEVRVYLVRREDGNLWVLWGSEGKVSLDEPVIGPQYSYNGQRWYDDDIPVPYYIHQAGSEDISDGSEFTAVQNSFQAWNDVSCSYMVFDYKGLTATPPSRSGQYDGFNVIGWMTKTEWGPVGPNVLAVTQWWYRDDRLLEFDIVFFEEKSWGTGGESGRFDVQSVGTHEAGHTLSLGHSSNPAAVMYYAIGVGQIKRDLHQDDIDGICAIYYQPPEIAVSPTDLAFLQDVTSGQVVPSSHIVSIEGHSAWTSAVDRSWIERTPPAGDAPATMTVSLSGTAAFGAGTYTGVVTVTGLFAGDAHPVAVRLVVADLKTACLPLVANAYQAYGAGFSTPTPVPPQPDGGADLQELRRLVEAAGHQWTAGHTSISRLSPAERACLLGVPPEVEEWERGQAAQQVEVQSRLYTYPAAIDWRNHEGWDWTTPIRNQGNCGSCVSFGTSAAIESRLEVAEGDPGLNPDLSEAHLFFCGCGYCCGTGWLPSLAMDFVQNTGVVDEGCYPYVAHDQPCSPCADWQQRVIRIDDWTGVSNVEQMKEHLSAGGPFEATMEVYMDFYYYTAGVYQHAWGEHQGGHAVMIVGYDDNEGYWIAKNSWGTGWGEEGWFRIAYGECGIDTYAYVPIIRPRIVLSHTAYLPLVFGHTQ